MRLRTSWFSEYPGRSMVHPPRSSHPSAGSFSEHPRPRSNTGGGIFSGEREVRPKQERRAAATPIFDVQERFLCLSWIDRSGGPFPIRASRSELSSASDLFSEVAHPPPRCQHTSGSAAPPRAREFFNSLLGLRLGDALCELVRPCWSNQNPCSAKSDFPASVQIRRIREAGTSTRDWNFAAVSKATALRFPCRLPESLGNDETMVPTVLTHRRILATTAKSRKLAVVRPPIQVSANDAAAIQPFDPSRRARGHKRPAARP